MKLNKSSRKFLSALFARIHDRSITRSMRKITRVGATLNFEFKDHFEGLELNRDHNFSFSFLDELMFFPAPKEVLSVSAVADTCTGFHNI